MLGKWEEAAAKLQGFDSEIENFRAQLQSTTQELDNKLSSDEALLRKQRRQVVKMQSTLDEMHTTQSTLVDIMMRIQDHVMQDGD